MDGEPITLLLMFQQIFLQIISRNFPRVTSVYSTGIITSNLAEYLLRSDPFIQQVLIKNKLAEYVLRSPLYITGFYHK